MYNWKNNGKMIQISSSSFLVVSINNLYPYRYMRCVYMNNFLEKFENILELGGIKRDIAFLIISGIALLNSMLTLIVCL